MTNRLTPIGQGGSNIAVALDRVGMNAASGRHLQAPHQFHFAVGRQIEERPLGIQRVDDRRVRQGLEGVVKVDAGQRRCEAPILPRARARHR